MPNAANSVAGTTLIKRANGTIEVHTPSGTQLYKGRPDRAAIDAVMADEHGAIKAALNDFLDRTMGVFDSRFHSLPINTTMQAPKKIPSGIGVGRL